MLSGGLNVLLSCVSVLLKPTYSGLPLGSFYTKHILDDNILGRIIDCYQIQTTFYICIIVYLRCYDGEINYFITISRSYLYPSTVKQTL